MKLPSRFSPFKPKEFAVTLRWSRHAEMKQHPKTLCSPAIGGKKKKKRAGTQGQFHIHEYLHFHLAQIFEQREAETGSRHGEERGAAYWWRSDLLSGWMESQQLKQSSYIGCTVCWILPSAEEFFLVLLWLEDVHTAICWSINDILPKNLILLSCLLPFSSGDRRPAGTSPAVEAESTLLPRQRSRNHIF